ncbi:MAG: cell division protein ZapE [Tistlia sp.]|uniref:cell division protein ZapE n=1 Tax=Tistlia sp. TaxID=3057121 RepID=UPI0034A2FD0F
MTEGPLDAYRALRRAGELRADPAQELAAEKLQSLHNALRSYRPAPGSGGWKARLGLARRPEEPPQGLYLYGPVGRGKSMLMDLFFRAAPVERKRRVHFHAFMAETHDRLHAWRRKTKGSKADPLPELAEELAEQAWLLCFDEFVVVNIADAMILARLFESLFERGVVVVATSNFEPGRLYEGGLQRERFLPFIALLGQRLDILDLGAGTDYRLARLHDRAVYHWPLGAEAEAALEAAFADLTEGAEIGAGSLTVKGRRIEIPARARGVARFGFAELCERPLGAEDYLAIATHFHSVVLSGVPELSPERRNEARRFMTLVDALYEHRVNLVVSAAAPPEGLYPEGDGAFEFRRTVSRLAEMQSAAYIDQPHLT